MGANLVGATGFGDSLQERMGGEAFEDPEPGDGGFTAKMVNHRAMGMTYILAQEVTGDMFLPIGNIADKSVILLVNLVRFKQDA